ncbi:MAG: guanylate kinase [Candidatus Omnitrophota bacterium]
MSSRLRPAPVLWIVSGPSGSGKTSLCQALLKSRPWAGKLLRSVSYTTRLLRPGELEGRDYRRIPEKKFLELKRRKAFLETERIFGAYYGTPKKIIADARRQGKDILLCIDVKGARTVRRQLKGKAVSIFIATPKLGDLTRRLRKRSTENKKDIQKRLRRVKMEFSCAKTYDHVVVNDRFARALGELKEILASK